MPPANLPALGDLGVRPSSSTCPVAVVSSRSVPGPSPTSSGIVARGPAGTGRMSLDHALSDLVCRLPRDGRHLVRPCRLPGNNPSSRVSGSAACRSSGSHMASGSSLLPGSRVLLLGLLLVEFSLLHPFALLLLRHLLLDRVVRCHLVHLQNPNVPTYAFKSPARCNIIYGFYLRD